MAKKSLYQKASTFTVLVLILLFSNPTFGQKKKDVLNPFKNSSIKRFDIIMIDVFYSGWDQPYQDRKPEWPSLGVGASYMLDMPFKKNNNFGFGLGLNYSWSTLKTDGMFVKDSLNNFLFNDINDNITNTVHRHLMSVPLEFRMRFPIKNNNFIKVYLGFSAGWQFRSTQISKLDNDKSKDILKDILSEWQYSPYLKVGYNDVFLFFRYELNNYLKKPSTENDMKVFQIGVSFGG